MLDLLLFFLKLESKFETEKERIIFDILTQLLNWCLRDIEKLYEIGV